jgi:hypothetical protein
MPARCNINIDKNPSSRIVTLDAINVLDDMGLAAFRMEIRLNAINKAKGAKTIVIKSREGTRKREVTNISSLDKREISSRTGKRLKNMK